jgi:small subunit ribosomal protein S20
MPNIKSAKKRALQTTKRQLVNQARRSSIKTAVKKVMTALEGSNIELAKKLFIEAESKLARARGKGLLHHNTAARKISRLAKKVSAATQSA